MGFTAQLSFGLCFDLLPRTQSTKYLTPPIFYIHGIAF